ncbi:MAG: hypothetical protein KDD82_15750 [Planctomycetes bacterium]|nr:hypothetical protein [Planctomycetota bacterium]
MKKLLVAAFLSLFLVGTSSPACSGMVQLFRELGSWDAALDAIAAAGSVEAALDALNDPDPAAPAPEPPPPPPPVFVQVPPDSLEMWDARETVATPEEAAPIEMEEQVVIS